ncbi:MAG: hypothetical protein LBI60_05830 [Bacteroidales bacterium]|jgi:chromosomal replication initiation ATPase DnaA|nr:hypothetical protein [Bacteroidales bacterium]
MKAKEKIIDFSLSKTRIKIEKTPNFFREIEKAIYATMKITFSEIVGKSRKRNKVYARMIFAKYMTEKGYTIQRVSKKMKHSHSTVVYYVKKYKDDFQYNPEFREIVIAIKEALSKI